MKNILIFTNSLREKSESFIINHIKFVSEIFDTTVLVQDSKIQIPLNLKLNNVLKTTIPNNFLFRILIVFKLLFKNYSYYVSLLNPVKFGKNSINLSLVIIASSIKEKDFDLIHCHFGNNGLLMAQLKKSGKVKGKIITHFHGLDFTSKKYTSEYYKDLIDFGDLYITVTKFSKSRLLEMGFDRDKIIIIPVGTDLNYFKREGLQRTDLTFQILFVGRLIELKGVFLLVKIAELLIKNGIKDFRIKIIGEGPLKQQLVESIKPLEDYFEILGFNSQEEIKKNMELSDVLIYPGIKDKGGRVENQCVVIQEAGAMELPVIAFDIGGVGESVINEQTGFLINPSRLDEFVEKLKYLINNKKIREIYGANARIHISKNYDLNQTNQILKSTYDKFYV